MKIGFIGYGSMARALSKRWAAAHEVFIGGRSPERAAELAEEVHAAGSGSVADSVQFGDVIVFATPANAVESAIQGAGGADAFAGKAKVAELIGDLGCDPVDVGELRYARLLEAAATIVIKFLFAGRDARTVLNLIQPESKPI